MKPLLLPALLFLLALPLFASDPYEQELASALSRHILVLRNYYVDGHLNFGSDGKLTSVGKPGFGPTEGRVLVHEVQLSPNKLTLTGTRPIDVFSQTNEKWELGDAGRSTSIEILLPAGEPANSAVPRLLDAVFLKQSELAEIECSADEEQAFLDDLRKLTRHAAPTDNPKLPDVGSLDELNPYCLPGGDRAYRVGRGITAPHAKYAPDPPYAEAARQAKLQGTTVLLIIVTPSGLPAAISVQRSLGSGLPENLRPAGRELDLRAVEAVSQWTFDPARFAGKPVPVAINVKVDFRLN
jgi:TonB family protein